MKKIIFLLMLSTLGFSQQTVIEKSTKFEQLFKTLACPVTNEDPEWVKKMYSENPNFFEIVALYDEYYKKNDFVKTTHTQNYKQFYSTVSSNHYYDEKGAVVIEEKVFDASNYKKSRLASKSQAGSSSWTPLAAVETFGGNGLRESSIANIYCIAQSQSNPQVMYCAAETSPIFKSTDKGLHWEEVGSTVFSDTTSEAIKIDPKNENIVYVCYNRRLYRSTDGGKTWNIIFTTNSTQTDIEISPSDSNVLFLSGSFGLRRSTDKGATWTTIVTDRVTDIEFNSADPKIVYIAKFDSATNSFQILKSINNGLNFTAKTRGWFSPSFGRAASAEGAKIANTKADPNRLYVLLLGSDTDYATDANFIGIYKSTDGGESWSLPYDGDRNGVPDNNPGGPYSAVHWSMSTTGLNGGSYDQGFYNAAIDVSDTNPDLFLVGLLNIFKSTDGGTTFIAHGGYVCHDCNDDRYRHPDIQGILTQGSDIWVASDGGIDQYDTSMNFLESRNNGLTATQFWGFDQGWNEDVVVGGSYHNGNLAYHENYKDGKSISLGGGESATGFVNLGENRKVYHDDIGGRQIPTTLAGGVASISNLAKYPKSGNSLDKSEIVNDPRWFNIIYLGKDNNLWKSNDYGGTFEILKSFSPTFSTVRGIEISRKDPNILFVAQNLETSVKLWKTIDGGKTWSEVGLPITNSQFTLSLNANDELYIAFDIRGNSNTKIYKSTNLGQSWTNITTGTLNGYSIFDIEVQEGTDGGVYAVCQRNVFYKNNSMNDWVQMSEGIPANFSLLDAKPFYKSGKLRMSGNRGVWEHDFYEPSAPIAQPMMANSEVFCERQEIQFEDYSILNHTDATWQWVFPGAATVSSTTVRNPIVTYKKTGTYDVTLTVTNPQGTSTKTVTAMVVVQPSICSPSPLAEKAVSMDGVSNQYLTKVFDKPKKVEAFTFTAWVKPSGIQKEFASILHTNGITLDFKNGSNELGTHCGGLYYRNSGLFVTPNKWSYVALIYTQTMVTLVLNENSYDLTGDFEIQNLEFIDFGINSKRDDRLYKGLVDEITIWDRALTLDEVRLNKHLMKTNNSDSNLFAYYQCNETKGNIVFDVKNDLDLEVIGGATVVNSTCPVGVGVSQLLNCSRSNTSYDFGTPKVKITTAGTNFAGNVVVTRLNSAPSNKPTGVFDVKAETYFIENYGNTADVGTIGSIEFTDINNITASSAPSLKLLQRDRNGDETLWADKGSPKTSNGTTLAFSPISITNQITNNRSSFSSLMSQSSGQFYLTSSTKLAVDYISEIDNKIILFPNPSKAGVGFSLKNIQNKGLIKVYDVSGKLVLSKTITENEIVNQIKQPGIYFYSVETDIQIVTGKVIVD